MAQYEARKVLLKDLNGRYIVPWTGSVESVNGIKPGPDGSVTVDAVPPAIAVKATTLNAGSPATVTKSGTDKAPVFTFGIPKGDKGDKGATGTRGTQWFSGTVMTGTSTTPTVFANSGIASALVGDYYLNSSTGYVYSCTNAGNASTAKWKFSGNIKGVKGDKGDPGPQGPAGKDGAQGPQGIPGVNPDPSLYLLKTEANNTYLGKNAKASSAIVADKVGTANLGNATTPIYLSAGVPKAGSPFIPAKGGTYTGTVYAPAFQISSDKRLKSNLNNIDSALSKLDTLTGYTYNIKGYSDKRAGLIAQDIQKVLPEAVMTNDDGMLTVDYGAVTALLVNAVKELQHKLETISQSN